MKKLSILALLFALLIVLCACARNETPSNTPPSTDHQQQPSAPDTPDAPNVPERDSAGSESSLPLSLEKLTVELVVEWEAADAILSRLDDLSVSLQTALDEAGCNVDRVTITISTAGGFTVQSLSQGGVNVAILPALDFISYEHEVEVVALSCEPLSETAIAVSKSDPALNAAFHSALLQALTESETGGEILAACCGDTEFSPPTEEALQLLRDYFAELEKSEGGHAS